MRRCQTWRGDYPRPGSSSDVVSAGRVLAVVLLERPVDLDQHLLLALGERWGRAAPRRRDRADRPARRGSRPARRASRPRCAARGRSPWRISADGLRSPRSIWLRYGFEMPASSLSFRSDSRALRRWSRMKSPRSCRRVSSESRRLRSSSRGPGDPTVGDLAVDRVDHAVHLACGGRRARARTRAARRCVAASSSSRDGRQVRERGVDDELLAVVGPVQLDRRRVGRGRAARVRDRSTGPTPRSRMRGRSATRSSTEPPRSRRACSASRISMRACARRR